MASNRKALEQIHLSKQNLVFDAENDNLEASLINQHHAGEWIVNFWDTPIIHQDWKGIIDMFLFELPHVVDYMV